MVPVFAQTTIGDQQIALDHLRLKGESWDLSSSDISEMRVTDEYTSEHNGVTHIYFVQQYNGVDVYQSVYNANILDGDILYAGQRLVPGISDRISPANGDIMNAESAVATTLGHLEVAVRGPLFVKERRTANTIVFDKGAVSRLDIVATKVYAPLRDGNYVLAWDVMIEPVDATDIWSIRINASSGTLIDKTSLTIACTFPHDFLEHPDHCPNTAGHLHITTSAPLTLIDGAQYNVVPIPGESPNHMDREMVINPADPDASPYGWHDLDGNDGADTTITLGNNVHAYIDRDGNFEPNEPATDGGQDLIFDFPFDQEAEPVDYQDAGVANLFYMNNIMHDFAYHYGFTEAAGNFQHRNYTGQGVGGDNVYARSQHGGGTIDPPLNNATFGTPSDGGNGSMRMFLWSSGGANELLHVDSPSVISGPIQTATTSDWGMVIGAEPTTGEVAIVQDASGSPTLGCNTLINEEELEGKIALIDRGSCEFGLKARNAEQAGAIGFIICNFEEGLVTMGGGAVGAEVTIPGVFIRNSDCQRIRVYIEQGLTVSLVNKSAGSGPARRTGSFDNGIVAHEYGHGISNRLTGGPGNAGCLNNYDNNGVNDGEQMGEGWSDFFTLITTVRPGDVGEMARPIGTYATGGTNIGGRPYPYSTDMAINSSTYDDIAFNSVPHGVGAVWCAVLWDLYWALTNEYGYDDDLYTGTGGNNLAIQLVMDGMKMQVCNPGFLDGRDAILAADRALTGGENQLLIWEVFARRGIGYDAIQGSNTRRHDNYEGF